MLMKSIPLILHSLCQPTHPSLSKPPPPNNPLSLTCHPFKSSSLNFNNVIVPKQTLTNLHSAGYPD